ncbi:uncharacterized protein LOC117641041 [Thrips palmi]|uniref:Uncharacterized protein LOC117641041 n=1 Tax=Thrips palmi TaxID=161013 RepID=A0A6P8Y3F0_THRPL|nr:uncharacterized protein LOC117641041 [Thrips palmi]
MLNLAPIALLMSGLLLCLLVGPLSAQSCTSCGPECVSACGSRRYRTCCFNYLRKRRSPMAPGAPPSEQLDLPAAGPASDALQGLPDDLRLQLVVVPNDQDGQQQEFPPPGSLTQSLLHRLLEAQAVDAQGGDGGGSVEGTSAPGSAPAPPPPAQRHRKCLTKTNLHIVHFKQTRL